MSVEEGIAKTLGLKLGDTLSALTSAVSIRSEGPPSAAMQRAAAPSVTGMPAIAAGCTSRNAATSVSTGPSTGTATGKAPNRSSPRIRRSPTLSGRSAGKAMATQLPGRTRVAMPCSK